MPLPLRSYFTVREIAARWGVSWSDLACYALDGLPLVGPILVYLGGGGAVDGVVLVGYKASAPGVARARACASGYRANSGGVTALTRASVHCAERMVATSNSNGVR